MKKQKHLLRKGIGLAALAAAGTYFLYGKRGVNTRAKVAGWALQVKGEVLEKMANMKKVDRKAFHELVEETADRYGRVKRVSASELRHLTADLKGAWTNIRQQLQAQKDA